jgi:plasmid maintenance system killer protein
VIKSFQCDDSERLFHREVRRRFGAVERPALRKLDMLDAASDLRTLSAIPGNRLERLRGDREAVALTSASSHSYRKAKQAKSGSSATALPKRSAPGP